MKTTALLLLLSCALAWPAAAQEAGMLDVDGGKIYYEAAGSGPVVVLVHGGFGDRRMWDDQFRALASRYRVVRYDHRGFGKSTAPTAAYSPVDDLVRLLDRVGAKRAHLVGNSLGGTLAIDAALKRPDRVASVTVVASGPNGVEVPKADVDSILAVFEAAEKKGSGAAAEMWLAHPMVAVSSKAPGARERLRAMVTENASIFRMQHWPDEPMDPPAAKRLGDVKVPVLVVYGDRDTAAVQALARVAAEGIPGAKAVVLRGADHLPQMTNVEEFNRALLDFLDRQPR